MPESGLVVFGVRFSRTPSAPKLHGQDADATSEMGKVHMPRRRVFANALLNV